MRMRAKFEVTEVANLKNSHQKLEMKPVGADAYGPNGENEDNDFSRFTPNGELRMYVTNPDLEGMFKPGDKLYLDFTPVNEDQQKPAYDNSRFDCFGGGIPSRVLTNRKRVFLTRTQFDQWEAKAAIPDAESMDAVFCVRKPNEKATFGGCLVVEDEHKGSFKRAQQIADERGFGETIEGLLSEPDHFGSDTWSRRFA